MSDSPSPVDPYLIEFNVTVASGSPTSYAWNFGDGQFWNGTGPGFASPAHRYSGPGNYTVEVAVSEGTLVSQQNLPLTIAPAALRVSIAHEASPGSLTETFTATVVGGSGSYPSVLWSFGDGGTGSGLVIRYTYQHPGSYVATLNVSDSIGHHVSGNATVTASGTGAAGAPGSPSNLTVLVAFIAIGAVGLAGTVAAVRWATRRAIARESIEVETTSPPEPTRPAEDLAPTTVLPPVAAAEEMTPGLESVPAPLAVPEAVPEAPAPEAPRVLRQEVRKEALRTSQRIVLHLWSLGTLPADEVAPLGFSQRGIAGALQVSQNALTNVLRRLVAGGVLVEDVRHVQGQPRRLKVYRLTPRGEALARDLRRASDQRAGSSTGFGTHAYDEDLPRQQDGPD